MRKMNIFFISPASLERYQEKQKGFTGSKEYLLFKGLVDKGHSVHLLMPVEVGSCKSFSVSGILIHEFKMLPMPPTARNLMSKLERRLAYYILFNLLSSKQFMCVMKRYGKPSVIYSLSSVGCIASFVTSRIVKVPNITRLYGTFMYPYLHNILRAFFYSFEEFMAFKLPCEYLIITNDGTKGDEVAKALQVPAERVKHWMNGVDFESSSGSKADESRKTMGIPPDVHTILSVSRLVKWKGVHRLIEATPAIVSDLKNVLVLIVGDGVEKKNLENLSEELNVSEFVKFLGAVPHSEVMKYMRVADIFVSLQDISNVSSSLLEAMACGRCIVTLNTGGTSEIVKDGQNGVVIEPNKLNDLPKVIVHLLKNDGLRKKLGSEAEIYSRKRFLSLQDRVKMEIELIEAMSRGSENDGKTISQES